MSDRVINGAEARRLAEKHAASAKTKQQRVARLRERLRSSNDPDVYALRDVLKGVLDLLADEL